jgi:CUB domain
MKIPSNQKPLANCSGDIVLSANGEVQYVKLPLVGTEYSNNMLCEWRLKTESPNHFVTINTGTFDLENSPKCGSDYLEVVENCTSTKSQRFCGNMGPVQYRSECSEVVLKFVSDSSDVKKGFQIAASGKSRLNIFHKKSI